jgi:hypothetical protein
MKRIIAPVNAINAMGIAGFSTDYTLCIKGWEKRILSSSMIDAGEFQETGA